MNDDEKRKTGKQEKKSSISPFSLLPDENDRRGKPGCPGGAAPWPNGCFDRDSLPEGCWGTKK